MRHFNYYPNGGPFPGVCALCGITRDLWDMGFDHPRGGSAMACSTCIGELAENIGWAPKQPLLDLIDAKNAEIDDLSRMLDEVPNHTEGLINGVRTLVTDFVFAVSDSNHPNRSVAVQGAGAGVEGDVEGNESADLGSEAPSESAGDEGSNGVSAGASRNKPGRPRKI